MYDTSALLVSLATAAGDVHHNDVTDRMNLAPVRVNRPGGSPACDGRVGDCSRASARESGSRTAIARIAREEFVTLRTQSPRSGDIREGPFDAILVPLTTATRDALVNWDRVTVREAIEGNSHMSKLYVFLQTLAAETRESERGQTMAEYAVVLAVITVAIIATLGLLAGGINNTLSSVTDSL
jgi:Flp pilus assembly pilin Flp